MVIISLILVIRPFIIDEELITQYFCDNGCRVTTEFNYGGLTPCIERNVCDGSGYCIPTNYGGDLISSSIVVVICPERMITEGGVID